MKGMRWTLLLFGLGAGILALAEAALSWDGAYYLLLLVDREAPVVPFHRYGVLILQAPAVLAQVLHLGLPAVRAAFAVTHAAVPAAAMLLSAWMVRGKRDGLWLWAVLGIGVATAPLQLFLVSEALQATQLAWPLALWVAAGMPRSRAPVAAALALALPFFHPIAVTLLGAIGLLAVATAIRNRSRVPALVGLGLLALALARYLPFLLKLDPQAIDTRRFTPHYHDAVQGLPLAAMILAWAGAIALAGAGGRAGRVRTWLGRFGAACVVAASAVLAVWAARPAAWEHALDYRTWVALLSLPLFAVAGIEGAIRRGPIAFDRFRATVAALVAAGFVVVIGIQSYGWTRLWHRLEGDIAAAPGACLAVDREVPWIEHTALSHWAIVSQAVLIQGRAPETLVVRKAADCAVPRFDEAVPITPWDQRPRQGGWFDFRRAGLGAPGPTEGARAAVGATAEATPPAL
jgi:hypothetical protein